MKRRTFEGMVAYFNKTVADMGIPRKYKMELLGMITAILQKHDEEVRRWVPCSERLPDDYTDVLVWFEYFRYGDYNCLYQTYGIGDYSTKYDSWMINHETGWHKLRVIAWMSLPEPYKEGQMSDMIKCDRCNRLMYTDPRRLKGEYWKVTADGINGYSTIHLCRNCYLDFYIFLNDQIPEDELRPYDESDWGME